MENNRTAGKDLPACCKKGEDPFEDFKPEATSSLEGIADSSGISDEDTGDNAKDANDTSFSIINPNNSYNISLIRSKSIKESPQKGTPSCCQNKVKPIERKLIDASITRAPNSTRRGSLSKAYEDYFNNRYNTIISEGANTSSSNYMSPSVGRSYGPANQSASSSANTSYYSRSHVPTPSRNYHTYGNQQPQYFSTPRSSAAGSRLDQTWGSTLNESMQSTRSRGIRPDTYSGTPLPRRVVPRVKTWYANPVFKPGTPPVQNLYNTTPYKPPTPGSFNFPAPPESFDRSETHSYVQSPITNPYKPPTPGSFNFPAPPESFDRSGTNNYVQSPNTTPYRPPVPNFNFTPPPEAFDRSGTQGQQETSYQSVPSFHGRPHSTPIHSQRASPQNVPRPQSAQVQSELPACCRGGNIRPKTAEAAVKGSSYCMDHSCGKKTKDVESCCNDKTCSQINLFSDKTQTVVPKANIGCQSGSPGGVCGEEEEDDEQILDTLLEIRTPHRPSGGAAGIPFVLSINVSCADRSVVITPDKGYRAISSNTSSQI